MNKLTLRDKENYAEPFFAAYKQARLKLLINGYLEDEQIIKTIEICLENLNDDSKLIIRNDYLKASPYHWYEDFYSKSTYFRYKNKAMSQLYEMLKTISNNDTI